VRAFAPRLVNGCWGVWRYCYTVHRAADRARSCYRSGDLRWGGGLGSDFNKAHDHLFVVGTEEGHIHKCSKAYNSQYLETYKAHQMAVYTVAWNHQHPKVSPLHTR
jgi:hypothetical protein